MKKEKPKKTFYTVLGVIGDCLFIPIMLISLIVCMFIFMDRRYNQPPSVFGISVVRILSGSMIASGFNINDNVIVKSVDGKQIWNQDIIAFYSRYDEVDIKMYNQKQLTKLETKDQTIQTNQQQITYEGRTTIDDAREKGTRIVFHEVIEVYADANGTRFFKTKGTSNCSADSYLVREDFVLGRYVEVSPVIRGAIKWICSPMGMIVLVCLPLGILVILQSLSLIEQINFIVVEKKLLAKRIDHKDPEALRLFKSGEMEEISKILYMSKTKPEDQDEVYSLIWGVETKGSSSKKQEYYQKVEQSFEVLKTKNKKDYLMFWKNNLKSRSAIKKIDDQLSMLIFQNVKKNINIPTQPTPPTPPTQNQPK